MDGCAVLSALNADSGLADIPLIMLTILDSKNPGYTLGASDYLTKPIDRDRLVAILKKYRCDLPNFNVLLVEDDAGNGRIRICHRAAQTRKVAFDFSGRDHGQRHNTGRPRALTAWMLPSLPSQRKTTPHP